jgi:hypothetical protein
MIDISSDRGGAIGYEAGRMSLGSNSSVGAWVEAGS